MKCLGLFGASGHGKVVADAALAAGWRDILFFDHAWPSMAENGSWNVVGDLDALVRRQHAIDAALVSIGNCAVRWRIQEVLVAAGIPLATVVHPRACVSPYAKLGQGTVVMAGAVVNIDADIGDACIINTGAVIDHDCKVAQAVHVSPGASLSGNVTVGPGTWIGVGAAVRQGIRIGSGTVVGAGAVVVKDVGDSLTVVGCPAGPRDAAN
ncbi:acetyltransferase [Cupriavidus nantongensis]|uniref:acetyltransferase n=1 Tax=Cupriavidus nantongensis TaxID=1796606 RepID=UPI002246DF78|nr:acetyltransferase [Cupriavidus nantongensis]